MSWDKLQILYHAEVCWTALNHILFCLGFHLHSGVLEQNRYHLLLCHSKSNHESNKHHKNVASHIDFKWSFLLWYIWCSQIPYDDIAVISCLYSLKPVCFQSRPVNRLNRDYDSGSDSDDDRPLDSGERFAMGERERTRSLAQILGSDFGLTSTDTETNRSGGRQHDSSDSHGNKLQDYSSDDYGKTADGGMEQVESLRQQRRPIHRFRSPAEISPRQEGLDEREKLPEHRHLYASMTTLTSGVFSFCFVCVWPFCVCACVFVVGKATFLKQLLNLAQDTVTSISDTIQLHLCCCWLLFWQAKMTSRKNLLVISLLWKRYLYLQLQTLLQVKDQMKTTASRHHPNHGSRYNTEQQAQL